MSLGLFAIGDGELVVCLIILAMYAIPIIVVVWALRTLWRLHKSQDAVLARLSSIEELLRAKR